MRTPPRAPLRWLEPASGSGASDSAEADEIHAAVEACQRRDCAGAAVAEGTRRRVLRLRTASGRSIVVKQFLQPQHARLREAAKRAFARDAAAREWKALAALRQAGAAVARPLARLRTAREDWLILAHVDGLPLEAALASTSGRARRALLATLGERIGALHRAGWIHGDLHVGNILVGSEGPVLLDLQRARSTPASREHDRDLAAFDFSLARSGLALTDRLRVRRAALGVRTTREALLRIGELSRRCERDHMRGRTRRCLVEGRRFALLRSPDWTGMRVRSLSEDTVLELFDRHAETLAHGTAGVIKHDERSRVTRVALPEAARQDAAHSAIVKEVVKRGVARQLADLVRGSAARRGWVAGHGLQARGIPAAQPLAFGRRRGRGGPALLVLEDLGVSPWLEDREQDPVDPETVCNALVRLLLLLHRQGVDHGDLQSAHLYGKDAPRLIDFEGVRFAHRSSDELRIRALAELNASLPDAWVPAALRRRALARYARALPFDRGERRALEEVVRRSLARRHHWRGEGCAAAVALTSR